MNYDEYLAETGGLHGLDMAVSISKEEERAITKLAKGMAKPNALFVEIGSWKGHSAALIATVTRIHRGHLYCVDHWKGNETTGLIQEAIDKDVYALFEKNLKVLGVWDYIIPLRMDSIVASKTFKDKSIDFLFIDGDHRYQQFKDDLGMWYPKIKSGGIICGHDCESYHSTATRELKELIDNNLHTDFAGGYHAGVIRGLFDYFNDEYSIVPRTRIWFKVV